MLHQIDLVVKERVNNLLGGDFISIVNKIAHSLRKQENLIRGMGSKFPNMTTRWLDLGSWSQWQLQHYEQLNTFFSSRPPDQVRPSEWYCPIVAAVFALFETVNRTMRALQKRNLLITQQRIMIDRIKKMTEVEVPLTDEELRARHDNEFIGDWTISYESITGFLDEQGLWIHDIVANLSEDNQLLVKREVGQLTIGFVLGVSRICTIRDPENRPIEDDFPSLFPSFLCTLRGRDFGALLARYREPFAAILHQICPEKTDCLRPAKMTMRCNRQSSIVATGIRSRNNGILTLFMDDSLHFGRLLGRCLQCFRILLLLKATFQSWDGKRMRTESSYQTSHSKAFCKLSSFDQLQQLK
ncbi:hypothetical protein PsorP6_003903 [Peronosclerospora sorghi]|uniref:Uncharacterized protein n=1 Tax=Peronosclerospora sorghi TaxID=230839 RepID=A0ACC0VSE0_9STRA|nr:hypothetical protein PsorP6_003903 [Peronosclerospora sorghi]